MTFRYIISVFFANELVEYYCNQHSIGEGMVKIVAPYVLESKPHPTVANAVLLEYVPVNTVMFPVVSCAIEIVPQPPKEEIEGQRIQIEEAKV